MPDLCLIYFLLVFRFQQLQREHENLDLDDKAKAEKLFSQKQQIVIISFEDRESTQESILTLQYKIDFGDEIVHSLKGTGEKLCVPNNNLVFNT